MPTNKSKQIATIVLTILIGTVAYGLFRTGSSITTSQTISGGERSEAAHGSVIDQTPLYTARRLAQMPASGDELPLAQEALRLGDREMDLAFAAAVSEAGGLVTTEGTLYPLLARLRKEGVVETTWRESTSGPPRRYYRLTGEGRQKALEALESTKRKMFPELSGVPV